MTKTEKLLDEANFVAGKFQEFMLAYDQFRYNAGLRKKVKNIHEICNAMTDKHGRICRHVKHIERKDPKKYWESEMGMSATGYLVYLHVLLRHYKLNIKDSMIEELMQSVKQHGDRKC